jgi:hypothetical protein
MINWLHDLHEKSPLLWWFGMAHFAGALVFCAMSRLDTTEVAGANAWYKPVKFALSIGLYSLSMAWYMGHLGSFPKVEWWIVFALSFETAYITVQAARGDASHFNVRTPMYSALYSLMAIGATIAALCAAYIGFLFWTTTPHHLEPVMLWAMRFGLLLFVVFAFQGFAMGSRLSHSVGIPDARAIPFLGWSLTAGDLRVAHFVGMHALQVLPLSVALGWRSVCGMVALTSIYFLVAAFVWWQALSGKPLLRIG